MTAQVQRWISYLTNPSALFEAREASWIASASADEISQLLEKTTGFTSFPEERVNVEALRATLEQLPQWAIGMPSEARDKAMEFTERIGALYLALQSVDEVPRQNLLSLLAILGGKKNLKKFCELLLKHPPKGTAAATIPFLPLFRAEDGNVAEHLFPDLLPGLALPDLAPAILDLANFLTRTERVPRHPAAERASELVTLLSGLTTGLENLQTGVEEQREIPTDNFQRYDDITGLVVSLCDALALIGDPSAVKVLNRVFDLRHRRLRTEAAAALARLGQDNGRQALIELAAEPAARLCVLKYAAELDLTESVEERFREPVAVAEAELVTFLAQPWAMGVPPTSCELVDCCTQYWPGYEEPRICYLFRYTYEGVDAQQRRTSYSNIGISGPLVHTFGQDLGNLPHADIYGAFAGWQTEHEEIYETDYNALNSADRRVLDILLQRVEAEGYQQISPRQLGSFFGDKILIADAIQPGGGSGPGQPGSVVVDVKDLYWYPRSSVRAVDGELAYYIYKGKRLLSAFND